MQKHSSSRVKQQRVYKNDEIKAFKVLVIDEEGNQLGLMPRAKALSMAEESGLDLVQLSYDATQQVSTAKLVDYGRYMYDKKKTEQEKKQRQQAKEQKEIKFGYTIGHNDLDLKIKKVAEFLDNGHVVRVSVVLKGREKVYKHLALEKMHYVEQALVDKAKAQGVKEEINGYSLHLFPKKH